MIVFLFMHEEFQTQFDIFPAKNTRFFALFYINCLQIKGFYVTLWLCSWEHNFLIAQLSSRTATSEVIFNEQILIHVEVCALGADFHSELEAVAGLTGYMAGLRFSFA